jgi:hypothetical protein
MKLLEGRWWAVKRTTRLGKKKIKVICLLLNLSIQISGVTG